MSAAPNRNEPAAPRNRWPKLFLIAFLVMLTPFVLVATTIAATGTVTVRVQDRSADGFSIFVPVPALLIDVAALVVPHFIPEHELADVRREIEPFRDGLAEMVSALEDCSSGTLVRVETSGEEILVEKRGRRFRVQVTSPDVNVDVSVPSRLARRALQMVDLI